MKNENLSEGQLETLRIIDHIELQLSILEFEEKIEVQKYWYDSAKEILKDHLKSSFIDSLILPNGINALNFKIVNGRLIKDFKWKITSLPNSILLNREIIKSHIIPSELVKNTRGYIEKLANQINLTYKNNCFDACSMCMRRLLEILLILTYQANKKEKLIQERNNYKNLSSIIKYTQSNNLFNLSKDTIKIMDEFRQLGNHAAHRIEYNCLKREIDDVKREFRVTVEELLYKSEIKK